MDSKADPIFTYKGMVRNRAFNMTSEKAALLGRLDRYYVVPDGSSRPVTAALADVDIAAAASDARGLYFLSGSMLHHVEADGAVKDIMTFDGSAVLYKLDGPVDSGGHALALVVGTGGMSLEFFDGTRPTGPIKLDATAGRPVAMDPKAGVAVLLAPSASGSTLRSPIGTATSSPSSPLTST